MKKLTKEELELIAQEDIKKLKEALKELLKELKRLTNYFINQGYKEVK